MTVFREMLKSKIHGATVTKKEIYYNGSIGIDRALCLKNGILPNEKVQVLNLNNGQRFETYVIEEKEGSGTIALYGPAARLSEVGDKVCILSYILISGRDARTVKPKVIMVNKKNKIK